MSFKEELHALGLWCVWPKNIDYFRLAIEINYGQYQKYLLYYEPQHEEFILRHPDDYNELLPVDLADPMCYEKLVEYMDYTIHLHLPKNWRAKLEDEANEFC